MPAQSLFEKYEDQEDVTSVVVNQKMFKMLSNIDIQTTDPDSDDFINQVKMLKNLTVYTTDNMDVSNSMRKDVEKYIKNSKLEELMRITDGDQTV
jgi:Flp pilus assembly CpaE family ATPase